MVGIVDLEDAMQNAKIEDLAHSVSLFDDYSHHPNPAINHWMQLFLGALLERSRKLRAHLIIATHRQRAGQKTALLNLETNAFVTFPVNKQDSIKLLRDHLGFSKRQLEYVGEINNGRHTYIFVNRVPFYLISQDRIVMLNTIE